MEDGKNANAEDTQETKPHVRNVSMQRQNIYMQRSYLFQRYDATTPQFICKTRSLTQYMPLMPSNLFNSATTASHCDRLVASSCPHPTLSHEFP